MQTKRRAGIFGFRRRPSSQIEKDQFTQLLPPITCLVLFSQLTGLQFTEFNSILVIQRLMLVAVVGALLIFHAHQSAHGSGVKYDLVFLFIVMLCFLYTVLTMSNKGSYSELAQKVSYILGPWLFLAVFGANDPRSLFRACHLAFFSMALANLLALMLTIQHGGFAPELGTYWLFGQRTYMRNILFPALFFSVINDCLNNRRITAPTVFLMVQNPLVLYAVNSMTSCMLSVVIDLVLLIMFAGAKLRRILVPFACLNILLSGLIVVMRRVTILSDFIINVLHRDLTFSGRVVIWDLVLERIQGSPLLGTGFHNINDNGLVLSVTKNVSNAHNELLDVAYKGGAIALFLFVALVARCCLPLLRKNATWVSGVLGLFIGAFFIEAVVADIWYPQFFLLLYLAAYISMWEPVVIENGKDAE